MIWFALIAAVGVGVVYGLIVRSVAKAFRAGFITLVIGVTLSILILFSGILGG
jgi:hypothetical protein